MKKLLTITCSLLLLMVVSSFATDTRVKTMGENNIVLLDEQNIYLFPSRINDYPNLAIGMFGYEGEYWGSFNDFGIHWKFGQDNPWVLGTYFSTLPAYVPEDAFESWLIPFDFTLMDNRRINLFYGRMLGEYNFGFALEYMHSSQTYDYPGNQAKESFGMYNLGFGFTPDNGEWDVSLGLGIGTWTDENAEGAAETEADGFFDLALTGRYFWQVDPNYTVIPHLGLEYNKRGLKNYVMDGTLFGDTDDLDYTFEDKTTALDVGAGLNYTPATNVLAVMDFGFKYSKIKHQDDTTDTYVNDGTVTLYDELDVTTWFFPYFKIGLDADVFKWMDVRLGATSYWTSETEEVAVAKFNQRWARNETYLGFGFHWGRLHVDTYTHPDLFLRGFNFISGASGEMNVQITALYEMM